jgi:hypothetical protein
VKLLDVSEVNTGKGAELTLKSRGSSFWRLAQKNGGASAFATDWRPYRSKVLLLTKS